MELVSIIVPVYGIEQYVQKCIESLINQTYKNIEIILVDDGSKDSSGKICDDYAKKDNRITVYHKQNGGLTSARNYGLVRASGEWIMHVDGDDWIDPKSVELLLNRGKETNAEIVFSDFFYEYPQKRIPSQFYDWDRQGIEGLKLYISSNMTCVWGCIIRRNLYDDNGLKSPEGITCCEDFHLIVRLCYYANRIAKVNRPLYHYSQRESSILHNLNKKTEKEEQWVYADIIRFFKENGHYKDVKKEMAWRTLKASQELSLNVDTFDEYCAYNPDQKNHIFDCPYIGIKLKIIAWCLTHRMRYLAYAIIKARNLVTR